MREAFTRRVPDGDTLERAICDTCGFIAYDNPKIVVGSVVRCGARILLCRRDINPSRGRWTLPAGYLEHGETPEEGARREAYEEATARIEIEGLLAVYTIRRLGQIQLIYRARLAEPAFAPGIESQAVALYDEAEIPWDSLAFPSVHWALRQARLEGGPFVNPPEVDGPAGLSPLGGVTAE
ncbi:NUDIX hydrolase [Acuticoccus kandeliae]|uniref:NUDIX hydrolase n=1 Tax=Acuticoccus kandeliae TaxID=2073160 RepID=UPI000D3E3004|nr:NUDIX hydrolase [Acuticoccus kandeliae]